MMLLKAAPITATQQMNFAAKKRKSNKSGGEASMSEMEGESQADSEEPQAATPATPVKEAAAPTHQEGDWRKSTPEVVPKHLFQPFSLGDIKAVYSTPDNKAPSSEDTIEGRYAGVLFTTASSREALFDVYEDMMYLSELYTHSESFRMFTCNAGVGQKEIKLLNKALMETAPFHESTMKFLEVLAENKRLIFIKGIAVKYQKLY